MTLSLHQCDSGSSLFSNVTRIMGLWSMKAINNVLWRLNTRCGVCSSRGLVSPSIIASGAAEYMKYLTAFTRSAASGASSRSIAPEMMYLPDCPRTSPLRISVEFYQKELRALWERQREELDAFFKLNAEPLDAIGEELYRKGSLTIEELTPHFDKVVWPDYWSFVDELNFVK